MEGTLHAGVKRWRFIFCAASDEWVHCPCRVSLAAQLRFRLASLSTCGPGEIDSFGRHS